MPPPLFYALAFQFIEIMAARSHGPGAPSRARSARETLDGCPWERVHLFFRPKGGYLIYRCTTDRGFSGVPVHFDQLTRLIARAIPKGARQVSSTIWEWNVAGRCQSPITVELSARPKQWYQYRTKPDVSDPRVRAVLAHFPGAYIEALRDSPSGWHKNIVVKPGSPHPLTLRQEVPCRRCNVCLEQKRRQWQARAKFEAACATRTWLMTLTLNPESQYIMQQRATARLERNGDHWECLTDMKRFYERHREISVEITKFLKRVREQSNAQLRFLCVAEAHKSGLPHYHLLIHEPGETRVTKRILQAQWTFGYSDAKLTDANSAGYVCKYIAKSMLTRVRASIRYGTGNLRPKDIAGVTSVEKLDPPINTLNGD